MTNLLTKVKLTSTAIPLFSVLLLTGCQQYLTRYEGITTHAGDTIAHNEAISVVDTWPDGFDDTHIPTDGQRQSKAIDKYKNPPKEKKSSPGVLKIVAGE